MGPQDCPYERSECLRLLEHINLCHTSVPYIFHKNNNKVWFLYSPITDFIYILLNGFLNIDCKPRFCLMHPKYNFNCYDYYICTSNLSGRKCILQFHIVIPLMISSPPPRLQYPRITATIYCCTKGRQARQTKVAIRPT